MTISGKIFSLSVLSLALAVNAYASSSQPVKDLIFPLCVNGECGLVDEQGTILVPFSKNNRLSSLDFKSFYIFGEQDKYGVKNLAGEVVIAAKYENIDYVADGLIAVLKDDKWGIIDIYASIRQQGDVKNDKRGIVDLKDATLIPPLYDDFTYYEKAGAFSMKKGEHYSLFDKSGQPYKGIESDTMMYEFNSPEDVESGFGNWIKVELPDNQGSYLFNTQTHKKTKTYANIYNVQHGHILVEDKNDLRTLLNADGEEIFPFKYDSSLDHPNNGWIAFRDKGKYGFLDMKGNVVIPAQYEYAGSIGKAGALVGVADPKYVYAYGVIDRKGEWVIKPTLPVIGEVTGGNPQVPLGKDGKMGVYDLNTLQWVVPQEYEWTSTAGHFIAAGDAPPGMSMGQEPGKKANKKQAAKTMGLFNYDGSVLLPRKYRMFNSPFAFGADDYTVAWMVQGEKQAVISPEGKEIIGLAWPKYTFVKPGLIIGGEESQNGEQTWEAYYDESGKLLFEYKTDACDQQQIVTGDQHIVWPPKLKVCKKHAVKH